MNLPLIIQAVCYDCMMNINCGIYTLMISEYSVPSEPVALWFIKNLNESTCLNCKAHSKLHLTSS